MLKFLGSGGAFNTERGNTSAYLELGSELFLFDLGEDVFNKLIKSKLFEHKTKVNIFITHLHGDHVGSLGTTIAYLFIKQFKQDKDKICIFHPTEAISKLLQMQGILEDWYTLNRSKRNEIPVDGMLRYLEYNFNPTKHTSLLNENGESNCYSLELSMKKEFRLFFSGDTNEFNEKLNNPSHYDYIYHEVTDIENTEVHFSYKRLLDVTKGMSVGERAKFFLMHLDEDFDVAKAKHDGFNIAENEVLN
jgi:ribonuclease BN (tRNA processing enzyme)